MTWGDRKSSRVSFERTIDTFMMGIDGTWRRNCQLVDVSATGARLIISGSIAGLNLHEFFLLLTPTGRAFRRCQLVRLDGDEIGVRFWYSRQIAAKGKGLDPLTPRNEKGRTQPYRLGSTSGACGLRSGALSTWDLRSAAFSTSPATTCGSDVDWASLRRIAA